MGSMGQRGVDVHLQNSLSPWEGQDWEPDNLATNSGHATEYQHTALVQAFLSEVFFLSVEQGSSCTLSPLKVFRRRWPIENLESMPVDTVTLCSIPGALPQFHPSTSKSFLGPFSRSVSLRFRTHTRLLRLGVLD